LTLFIRRAAGNLESNRHYFPFARSKQSQLRAEEDWSGAEGEMGEGEGEENKLTF
jgi:hypothetical protein